MKISIIIPVYNAEKYIEKCINSALSQTYTNMEILVCDDASNDNTNEILKKKYKNKIKLIENNKREGVVASRNKLLDISSGDLISLLDADDTITSDRNQIFINQFKKNKDLILCGSNFNFYFNNKIIRKSKVPISSNQIKKNKIYNSFLGAAICYRKNKDTKEIRFRNFFNHKCYEDVDFILQISRYGNIKNVKENLYNYNYYYEKLKYNINNYDPFIYIMKEIIIYIYEKGYYNNLLSQINDEDLKLLEKKLINKYDNNIYKLNYQISLFLRLSLFFKAYKKFLILFFSYPFSKITYKNLIKILIINKFTYNFFYKL